MSEPRRLTHDEVTELSGLYALDALDATEREAARRHLAECPQPHREFEDVGGVVPALGALIEPVDPPADLRQRVLSAIAAEGGVARGTADVATGTRMWRLGRRDRSDARSIGEATRPAAARPAWLGWAAAALAVLVIAALGAWGLVLQARTNELEERSALIAQAVAVLTTEGSEAATLRGTGPAAGASGFAAFTPAGEGYVVLVGLPPAPPGRTYQAWFLVDGQPFSAGVVSVGDDGFALLSGVERLPGTDAIAFTLEQAGGAVQPTSDPIVSGEVG